MGPNATKKFNDGLGEGLVDIFTEKSPVTKSITISKK